MIQILHWANMEFSFKESHVADINNLLRQLTAKHRDYSYDDIQDFLNQDNLRVFAYIDDSANKIVGMAVIKIDDTRMFTQNYCKGFVGDVIVDENYRGRGIARDLMSHLIDFAMLNGLSNISLTSNPNNPNRAAAIKLYESLGFKKIGELNGSNYYRLNLKS